MKKRSAVRILFYSVLCVLTASVFFQKADSHVAGAPSGETGSPGDGSNCTSCHAGPAATSQAGWITSNIPCAGYVPGTTYTFTATATGAAHSRFGFEISPQNSSGSFLGTLIVTSASTTQLISAGHYITHTSSGTTGTTGFHTWNFNWTAPASGSGTVTFYGAFNLTNNSNTNAGDTIMLSTLSVSQCTTPPMPSSISGTDTVCANTASLTYSATTVSCATSYNWTVPPGSAIVSGLGTSSIVVNAGSSSGNVCVSATNGCGTSGLKCKSLVIRQIPGGIPGTITGSDSVCAGSTNVLYSVMPVTWATNYSWTFPSGGSVASGQGTTAAHIDFGSSSGNVCMTPSNVCGSSSIPMCKNIVVSGIPSLPVITGDTTVCPSTEIGYCCANHVGSAYLWTAGTGGIITGQGTNCISAIFSTAGSTQVTAVETNSAHCPSGAASANITVFNAPAIPTITQLGDSLVSSPASQYQWLVDGVNISGATSQKLLPSAPGFYSVMTTDSNGCTSNSISFSFHTGIHESFEDIHFDLSPNPFHSELLLSYSLEKEQTILVEAYDITGRKVITGSEKKQSAGDHRLSMDTGSLKLSPGLYLVKISYGDKVKILRVLKSE